MGKSLFIAEKPSVAQEFARALKISGKKGDGFIESETAVVTWCVGHLVTMSYPESYDPALKRWSMDTLPFLPKKFKYQVIDGVKKQFLTVKKLLTRPDVDLSLIHIWETGGLGTVATRADIIEKLFSSFLLEKKGKDILLTSKARQLLELVPEDLKKPELTADWEMKLSRIARGELSRTCLLYTSRCV